MIVENLSIKQAVKPKVEKLMASALHPTKHDFVKSKFRERSIKETTISSCKHIIMKDLSWNDLANVKDCALLIFSLFTII